MQRSLDTSSSDSRRGASRPTIVLGFASLGGFLGMVAGAYVGATAFGAELPDDAEYLPFFMMLGAGAGWLLGTGLGSVVGEGARAPGTIARRLMLVGAFGVVIGASVTAIWPVSSGWPARSVVLFSFWRGGAQTAFEVTTMVNAALAVSTFVAVSRSRAGEHSWPPGRVAGGIGIGGLFMGGLAFVLGIGLVPLNWSETVAHQ
jgi:hypothetical protein